MNTVNRVVIVVLLLTLMALLTTLFVLPHIVLTNVGGRMVEWGKFFGDMSAQWLRLTLGLLLSFIVDALIAFLIFLEVHRTRKRFIRVQQVTGGMATISTESIVQQLQHSLDPIVDVIKVAPSVNAKRDKVQTVVDVEVGANANVPRMATELIDMVQKVLTENLGLQVYGQPEVRIKVATAPAGAKAKPTPSIPEPEPVPASAPVPPPLPEVKSRDWAGQPPRPEDQDQIA
jgi:hypothetical protein